MDKEEKNRNWEPSRGVVMKIEFDHHILNELRHYAEKDGVGSVYQMIRNACYGYVSNRKRMERGDRD